MQQAKHVWDATHLGLLFELLCSWYDLTQDFFRFSAAHTEDVDIKTSAGSAEHQVPSLLTVVRFEIG